MGPPRAPHRDLDRLRGLSPLSQHWRRTPGMNPRTPLVLSPRGGGSSSVTHTNAVTPKASLKPVREASTPTTPARPRLLRSASRPTRVNVPSSAPPSSAAPPTAAVTLRKGSAPGKLISNVLGASLENLPSTVSTRRKTSAPAKTAVPNASARKTSAVIAPRPRKTSAPTISTRMSKDHAGAASNQQVSKGTSGSTSSSASSVAAAASGPQGEKGVKKGTAAQDMQPLPTLKEERKPQSKTRKMDGKGKENSAPPATGSKGMEVTPASTPAPTPTPAPDTFPEKVQLEKTISDLVKNAETKKQEMAALKMEINRLKESARERESAISAATTSDECHRCKSGGSDITSSGKTTTATTTSATSPVPPQEVREALNSLTVENKLLKDRLAQLGVSVEASPLSDQEKELLLSKVCTVSQNGGEGEDPSSCADRNEWDNKSTSSVSEVSVACLQDRIQQMEETHYCTNEELQATLQELDDLREQLAECTLEVQQLQEEKQVILESLTQQTEKLAESRSQNDTLKHMVIQQSENSQDLSQCEKTQRLMELLKSAQEDRELLQIKQDELEQQLTNTKEVEERFHRETQLIRDRMKLLEAMVEAATNEKKAAENQLAEAQENCKASEIETTRLKTALEAAKEKITELEAAVISGEKSKLPDVLERVRQEKDALEKENAALQQRANASACENERLRDQISVFQDELMVARNNAKSQLEDADWKKVQLETERLQLHEEVEVVKATVEDLKLTCQRHLEDKRELKANLSEAQKKLQEANEKLQEKERFITEGRAQQNKKEEEWQQFQNDLLMTVRVANDFKTEAQHERERLEQENLVLKEKVKTLETEKTKASKVCAPVGNSSTTSLNNGGSDRRSVRTMPSALPNGDPSILADRRNTRPLARGDSRVKSLIESIESATRQTRSGSRSSSTSSLCSTSSEGNINNNNNNSNKTNTPILKRADTESMIRSGPSSPLKDARNTLGSQSPLRALQRNSFSEGLSQSQSTFSKSTAGTSNLSNTVKLSDKTTTKISSMGPPGDNSVSKPISILSNKLDHSMRRNSYGQISAVGDKKDPLASLAQNGGSKRNALLKWCQNKTVGYTNVDITNFSSSWNDGLALCAILDTYLPEKINYKFLSPQNKRENFQVAISAAESVGIPNQLDVSDMITSERPNWQTVYTYVTSIYCHFET
ncbi:cytospin-A-like isoform X2 [Eriocheir sinensis]|uniref:cytospin-A-like isoform X2 n=1 Tax=Eriocheir sinensis TaxID=95602 RepID=UPI0021C6F865|nr:cytospin-A-like isoform X2 [Eriocheir sinensis]